MSTATLPRKNAKTKLLTIDQFLDQYGERPADLIRGTVVEYDMPGFQHGRLCFQAAKLIDEFVTKKKLGRIVTNDTHVQIERGPDTARGMDVCYISFQRLPATLDPERALEIAPELVVEVRSPTDRWKGVLEKVIDHMNIGVDVVMVLDMKTTSITVFRQDEGQVTFSSKE